MIWDIDKVEHRQLRYPTTLVFFEMRREEFPCGVPGQVRVIMGRTFVGPPISLDISRHLELALDTQGALAAKS